MPEHQGLQDCPDLGISPVFTEDVGWVDLAANEVERNHASSDTFPNSVKR